MILLAIIALVVISYVSLILAYTLGLKRALSKNGDGAIGNIKLSVLVAFRNEEANLPVLLNALLAQTLTHNSFDLIFVDDHSTDNSLLVAQSYCSKFQNLTILSTPSTAKGKKAALVYGLSQASNPIIVFTDADCIPSKFWLEAISTSAARGADFMIGAVVMNPVNSFSRKLQSLEYSSLMATALGSCGIGHPVIASSANLAFRKSMLNVDSDSMNPTVSSGDDIFLLHRAKKLKNCRIEFLSDKRSIVQTSTEATIAKALRQRKRWASKSVFYKDFDTIYAGFVVLIFNLLIVSLLFASIFNVKYLFCFFTLLAVKSFVDYCLLNSYLKFTAQNKLLRIFLLLQLMYPFYIVYSFFLGVAIKGNWKGRSIN